MEVATAFAMHSELKPAPLALSAGGKMAANFIPRFIIVILALLRHHLTLNHDIGQATETLWLLCVLADVLRML